MIWRRRHHAINSEYACLERIRCGVPLVCRCRVGQIKVAANRVQVAAKRVQVAANRVQVAAQRVQVATKRVQVAANRVQVAANTGESRLIAPAANLVQTDVGPVVKPVKWWCRRNRKHSAQVSAEINVLRKMRVQRRAISVPVDRFPNRLGVDASHVDPACRQRVWKILIATEPLRLGRVSRDGRRKPGGAVLWSADEGSVAQVGLIEVAE